MSQQQIEQIMEAVRALLSNLDGPYRMYGTAADVTIYEIDPRYVAELRALVPERAQ